MEPRFCSQCGAALERQASADSARYVCGQCRRTHYRNPAVGVAVVVRRGEAVLLGRRARGPYAGRWCIPCGYVEWGEDVRAAAKREFTEETGLEVSLGAVLAVHSNFHDSEKLTVGVWFEGTVTGGGLRADDDLDEVDFWPLAEPPPLAFPTDALVIAALLRGN